MQFTHEFARGSSMGFGSTISTEKKVWSNNVGLRKILRGLVLWRTKAGFCFLAVHHVVWVDTLTKESKRLIGEACRWDGRVAAWVTP